jgi:hypothetical protein
MSRKAYSSFGVQMFFNFGILCAALAMIFCVADTVLYAVLEKAHI